ncbi:MAG: hypothetical protein A3H23_06160 [Planctomycetes bacterium RIFCSPLOWO2_12_FULL_40_19]|nr:MAG: hypothetical protein A3H23_06160 [Planctomycetes bacterium RIFCSPLOWO2_12_FULL_40_19]
MLLSNEYLEGINDEGDVIEKTWPFLRGQGASGIGSNILSSRLVGCELAHNQRIVPARLPVRTAWPGGRRSPARHVFLAGTGTYPPVPIRAGSGR